MLKLEDLRKDAQIQGLEHNEIVRLVAVEILGDNACTVVYRRPDGRLGEQTLFRSDEDPPGLGRSGPRLGL